MVNDYSSTKLQILNGIATYRSTDAHFNHPPLLCPNVTSFNRVKRLIDV